ncbi:hypothetical protein OQA88_10993 [Cercophora sp. LCS_1]
MPRSTSTSTHQLHQTTTLIDRGRSKLAAATLLSLDPKFINALAAGTDMHALANVGRLFQSLINATYHRCCNRAVDLTINRLVLKTVKGCENRLRTRIPAHDPFVLQWMSQPEIETRELLDICREFLNYITAQDAEFCPLQDPLLFGARRILQRVAPRINCLGAWEGRRERGREWIAVSTRPRVRVREEMKMKARPSRRMVEKVVEIVPTVETELMTEELSLESEVGQVGVTVPTVICTPRLRIVDGMIEEVTQAFEPTLPSTVMGIDQWGPDEQLKREWAEWKEREERPFVMLTPDLTPMVR